MLPLLPKLIEVKNELAIIMIIHEYHNTVESDESIKKLLSEKADEMIFSWLISYELYLLDLITTEQFELNEGLKKNIKIYNKLKSKKISFYSKIITQEEETSEFNIDSLFEKQYNI